MTSSNLSIRAALTLGFLLLAPAASPGECTHRDDPLQILDFYLDMEPGDWDDVRHDLFFATERPALFHCGDEPSLPVRVRRKDSHALPSEDDPVKVSLKIDFDDRVEDGEWHGHRKISLENGYPDPSFPPSLVKEGISWHLMARAGVIAGGFSWVRLHVNGRPLGIYTRIEQIDKSFLRRHLGEDEGFLYKREYSPEFPDKKKRLTRLGEPDPYDVNLCFPPFDARCGPPASGIEHFLEHVDLHQLLTLGAVNSVLANADGFLETDANYFWYNSEQPRRYFPWDLDLGLLERDLLRDPHWSDLLRQLFAVAPILAGYFDGIIRRLCDDLLAPEPLEAYFAEIAAAIGPAIEGDPLNGLKGSFADDVKRLQLLLNERVTFLRARLESHEPAAIAINEVLASNHSTNLDENGDNDDWVELFNRSDAPVSLGGLYLSDDPARPLRWALPDVVLPSGGHLLIWCDGDAAQGPLHANFRLNGDGEVLGLYSVSGRLLRTLDFAWFRPQEADVSLGRFPDGSAGLKRLVCPTPRSPNRIECPAAPTRFRRGDVKADGAIDVSDAVQIIGAIFLGAGIECWRSADAGDDGEVDLTDAVQLLSFLYLGAPPLSPPFPDCGSDPTPDSLSCDRAAGCD